MIDPNTEEIISLKAASRLPCLCVNGQPRHVATLYRWFQSGRRGTRLETILIGGTRATSREAVNRFLAAVNPDSPVGQRTPTRRHSAIDRAEASLARDRI